MTFGRALTSAVTGELAASVASARGDRTAHEGFRALGDVEVAESSVAHGPQAGLILVAIAADQDAAFDPGSSGSSKLHSLWTELFTRSLSLGTHELRSVIAFREQSVVSAANQSQVLH
jgi:hypothetical protein